MAADTDIGRVRVSGSNQRFSDRQSGVQTYRRTLSQLVRSHHLHVQVFGLRLAPGLDEPLQHLEAKNGRRHKFKGSNFAEEDDDV